MNKIKNGVMFNAYPDSMGGKLNDIVNTLQRSTCQNVFSHFYILPTFFNSDLDRGFSIKDYDLNKDLVSSDDIVNLKGLGINPKFDIVLNHLSVQSPQFLDLLENGDASKYKDFFIDWNEFWKGEGEMNEEGIVIPYKEHLEKLFMRKSGLPILKVIFPDGSERPYWNTFYQKIYLNKISSDELKTLGILSEEDSFFVSKIINDAIESNADIDKIDLETFNSLKPQILKFVKRKRGYLGQMDVNAKSPLVWEYYEDVLDKMAGFGCKILRLDAFAYLHKEVGQSNFFNKPGTWDYLDRINEIAKSKQLVLLPEIHAEYGLHLHDELADRGYMFYDFFLPGLILHAIEKGVADHLIDWGSEVSFKGFKTVNMLGCHDGIPLLDLKGKEVNGVYQPGLLEDEEIEEIMNLVIARGGKVKNLYGADGKKLSYYQVNATYFSALGEDENKLLLARAIQIFMPGIPQVWYLDLFAGKNDYDAVEKAGADGHKEINRTNLSVAQINAAMEKGIVRKQLELLELRNNHQAFDGIVLFENIKHGMSIKWENKEHFTELQIDFGNCSFEVICS